MNVKIYSPTILLGLFLTFVSAQAQNIVFTYQGCVTDGGSNFTGAGQFQFALVTSANSNLPATATANLSGPFVTSYNILSGGSGYVSVPTVTITGGGGSGAAATATISDGVVTGITPVNAGSNYTSTPIVALSPPPPNTSYTTYWSNDGASSAGSEPVAAVSVAVSNGLFTIVLGDTTVANMTPISASLFAQPNLQLRIWFNDGANGWEALSPPQDLTPAPYAVIAQNAGSLAGPVLASQLSGAVGNAQLANSSVTVTAGTGLNGGGTIALGSAAILNNTGLLSISGNEDITASSTNGVVTLGSTATSDNSTNTIVKRDGSGNFSAGTITLAGALSLANPLNNTVVGSGALAFNTNGTANSALGSGALSNNTSGYQNTATGYLALAKNTNGFQNTAHGAYALSDNLIGCDNTASGWAALLNNTVGSNNTAGGAFALFNNLTGIYNTANGVSALYYNTAGSSNAAIGFNALLENETGALNVAVGASALYASISGNNNTAVGASALSGNTSGNNNIALGYAAGTNIHSGANNIDIGSAGVSGDNGVVRVGTPGVHASAFVAGISGTTVSGGAPVYVNSLGQLGTLTSSQRFKTDIQSMGDASDELLSLHPVTFRYKPELDPVGLPQFGLIAEEVSRVDPDLVLRDHKNQIYSVRYEAVNAMLLNEFLKQHRKVEEQQAEIQSLKEKAARVDSLEKRLTAIEQALLVRAK